MQAAVSTIQTALATHDFADVEALMLEEVAVSVEEVGGETMSRTAARAWLAQRLGPDLRLEEWRTVEHYGLLEVITVGWQPDEQATAGRVTFNLHRFDDQGRQDALRGSWKIDVIVAE